MLQVVVRKVSLRI